MARKKGKKPGPRKGQPKPLKRVLDHEFPVRLREAMIRRGFRWADGTPNMKALADEAGCTPAVIGQYLSLDARKKTVDLFVFLDMCDALWVTPYWLALKQGTLEDVEVNKIPMERERKKTHG